MTYTISCDDFSRQLCSVDLLKIVAWFIIVLIVARYHRLLYDNFQECLGSRGQPRQEDDMHFQPLGEYSYLQYCVLLGVGSQNEKCRNYVIVVLHNVGLTITSKIKQTRSFYVS